MTRHMKIFNFRNKFYQKVTHCSILVSKTIYKPPQTFKIQYERNLDPQIHSNTQARQLFNPTLQKANLQTPTKTNKPPDNQPPITLP